MSLNDYVLRWLKRKDISTETFSEADYVVKDKSIVCKFKLSASRTCNHKVTVGTDQAGRWKIDNFTRHVLEHQDHIKSSNSNSPQSGRLHRYLILLWLTISTFLYRNWKYRNSTNWFSRRQPNWSGGGSTQCWYFWYSWTFQPISRALSGHCCSSSCSEVGSKYEYETHRSQTTSATIERSIAGQKKHSQVKSSYCQNTEQAY